MSGRPTHSVCHTRKASRYSGCSSAQNEPELVATQSLTTPGVWATSEKVALAIPSRSLWFGLRAFHLGIKPRGRGRVIVRRIFNGKWEPERSGPFLVYTPQHYAQVRLRQTPNVLAPKCQLWSPFALSQVLVLCRVLQGGVDVWRTHCVVTPVKATGRGLAGRGGPSPWTTVKIRAPWKEGGKGDGVGSVSGRSAAGSPWTQSRLS